MNVFSTVISPIFVISLYTYGNKIITNKDLTVLSKVILFISWGLFSLILFLYTTPTLFLNWSGLLISINNWNYTNRNIKKEYGFRIDIGFNYWQLAGIFTFFLLNIIIIFFCLDVISKIIYTKSLNQEEKFLLYFKIIVSLIILYILLFLIAVFYFYF